MVTIGVEPWLEVFKEWPWIVIYLSQTNWTLYRFWNQHPNMWIILLEHLILEYTDKDYAYSYPFTIVQHHQFFKNDINLAHYIKRTFFQEQCTDACIFDCNLRHKEDLFQPKKAYTSIIDLWIKSPNSYDEDDQEVENAYRPDYVFFHYLRATEIKSRRVEAVSRFFRFFYPFTKQGRQKLMFPADSIGKFHGMLLLLKQVVFISDKTIYTIEISWYEQMDERNMFLVVHYSYHLSKESYEKRLSEHTTLIILLQDILDDIYSQKETEPSLLLDLAPYRQELYHPITGLYNTNEKQKQLLLSELVRLPLPESDFYSITQLWL